MKHTESGQNIDKKDFADLDGKYVRGSATCLPADRAHHSRICRYRTNLVRTNLTVTFILNRNLGFVCRTVFCGRINNYKAMKVLLYHNKLLLVLLSFLFLFLIGLLPLFYVLTHRNLGLAVLELVFYSFFLWIVGWAGTVVMYYFMQKKFNLPKLSKIFVVGVSFLINVISAFSFPLYSFIVTFFRLN